uniref:Uncharacterized protein n=1 Tax=Aegilops tauschii TaxID=37682 RepID=R7W648_AEGTA
MGLCKYDPKFGRLEEGWWEESGLIDLPRNIRVIHSRDKKVLRLTAMPLAFAGKIALELLLPKCTQKWRLHVHGRHRETRIYNHPLHPTMGAPLLQLDIADSIPISMRNFTDIVNMFVPVSYTMANDIWLTLNMCERVRPLKGEKKTCISSVESMVEFVSSVLGSTHDLQAFSPSQVPNEGVVTRRST